jgi:LPXTG-site transpeptidase (sortase) family protein
MTHRASIARPQGKPVRRRPGWGAVLGLMLASAGLVLLLLVLMAVLLGRSWPPTQGPAVDPPPAAVDRPDLAPKAARGAIVLPTPLADDLFLSANAITQDGDGALALLPQSPAGDGQLARLAPAASGGSGLAEPLAWLEIPAIGVYAPIQPVGRVEMEEDGQLYLQWQAPAGYAVGWHNTSARPGTAGNTVLNGHNNIYGAVFRDLVELGSGDEMTVYEDGQSYRYRVAHSELLEENDQPLDVRLDNAKWMLPTSDDRLTLISCWPIIGATHRVIVVALAVDGS